MCETTVPDGWKFRRNDVMSIMAGKQQSLPTIDIDDNIARASTLPANTGVVVLDIDDAAVLGAPLVGDQAILERSKRRRGALLRRIALDLAGRDEVLILVEKSPLHGP